MAASGGRRKCALCLVTFVSFLVMTLLLSAMSSSKEDLRESLSKISNQDIGETAMQAMEFFILMGATNPAGKVVGIFRWMASWEGSLRETWNFYKTTAS